MAYNGSTLSASRWLLIGNNFLRNIILADVTNNTILSHGVRSHIG
jgi:hypothetical protein